MPTPRLSPLAALAGLTFAAPLAAQAPALVAARRDGPIAVDGRLDEAAWAAAAPTGHFVQQRPLPGGAPSERTEARILYDDLALYAGMRLFDSAPDSIVAPLGRRDYDGVSDWAHVIIDSYFDRRTAFRFAISPSGVKRDGFLSGDNDWSEDLGWDAIWEAATSRDSLGWTAEFRIPLTQLRFSLPREAAEGQADATVTWGLEFIRDLARRDERSMWAPIPPDGGRYVSHFGTLGGLAGLAPPRRLEIVPYTLARATRAPGETADPFHSSTALGGSAGADVRMGLGPSLTLSATLNPDFGQVEADPSEVNLTALETFLGERRPFFVEGGDIFRFDVTNAGWALGSEQLFYSRRIGRAPQGEAPDDAPYSDAPAATTLLGAAKLSGKTAGGWSVGALGAVTDEEQARYERPDGAIASMPIEPRTAYLVARTIRDFRGGRSTVGAITTATHRRLDGAALDFLHASAHAGGVDWQHQFGGDNYRMTGNVLGSIVRGTPAAITRTQRSSAHYFQRPDAHGPALDSSRTSLAGVAAELRVTKMGGSNLRWGAVAHAVSPGFEINDLGFAGSSNYAGFAGWVGWLGYRPTRFTRSWQTWTNVWTKRSLGGERLILAGNDFTRLQLRNYWEVVSEAWREAPRLSLTELRGGPALRTEGRTGLWLRVLSDSRRDVGLDLQGSGEADDHGRGRVLNVQPGLRVRPSARLEVLLQPGLTRVARPGQFIDTAHTAGGTRYLTGRLSQTTVMLTGRLSFSFTPQLSLQMYAQPFLSAGDYTDVAEVRAPRAVRIDERFRRYAPESIARRGDGSGYEVDRDGDGVADLTFDEPDFRVRQLRSNAVLRWEYRPGSTLFVVWSRDADSDDDVGRLDLARDARRLLGADGTNVLLVKMSYWLGR